VIGLGEALAALAVATCLVASFALVVWARASYLALAALGRRIDRAWANLSAALEERQTLLGTYLAVLERAVDPTPADLDDAIRVAARARDADDPTVPITERADGAARTTTAVHLLLATVDSLPDLRAVETISQSQRAVIRLEGVIAARRDLYAAMVVDYDRRLSGWPGRFWAHLGGWRPRPALKR
jgi:hypothetical protein